MFTRHDNVTPFRARQRCHVMARSKAKKAFCPQKTAHVPQPLCWEIVLSNPQTGIVLSKWRWIWVLRQVSRAFHDVIQPDRWIHWQCANDLRPMIWKRKADEVLALTCKDLGNIKITVSKGASRYKETHLMWRKTVLELALTKHCGTFNGVNSVFLKRLARRSMK